jgi:hypothetical protein
MLDSGRYSNKNGKKYLKSIVRPIGMVYGVLADLSMFPYIIELERQIVFC